MTILAVAAGFAADLAFGDPRWLPHPVVAMGRAITWVEGRLRGAFPQTSAGTRATGLVLAVALPLTCGLLTWGILHLCGMVHSGLRFVAEAWASYQILAACELRRQSLAVARAFSKGGLVAAREAVGLIVGRDTSVLDEQGVARAAVETVAENASDGVIAPLFYLMIGGAPLGMAYKAVNTLDSMVGYKNERYIDFGCASARLDDVLNWIPSRLSALLMIAVCPIVGLDARGAARIWRRDRRRHASPNSAQTESACAGALGLRLAGPAVYFGKLVEKPTIGDASREIEGATSPGRQGSCSPRPYARSSSSAPRARRSCSPWGRWHEGRPRRAPGCRGDPARPYAWGQRAIARHRLRRGHLRPH